ncbi:MAG: energy transducer TonB [Alistipes sp.]|nr:energy transducer TonB [Alistipes sp.]
MEIKKSPKADLQNRKGLFLEIGLIISLLIVVAAFKYAPKEYRIEAVEQEVVIVEEEIVEITRNELKPPAPPQKVEIKVYNDILDIVTNDTEVKTDISFEEFVDGLDMDVNYVVMEEEEIEEDTPIIKAEKMPTFQGGDLMKFREWVQKRLRYPQIAQENGISGRVTLTFVIEKDGTLTNIEVMQSPDRSLSEEAIRVLNTSPKWEPGKQRNQPVRVRFTLPVAFQIRN